MIIVDEPSHSDNVARPSELEIEYVLDKIKKQEELRDQGVITEEAFESKEGI